MFRDTNVRVKMGTINAAVRYAASCGCRNRWWAINELDERRSSDQELELGILAPSVRE